MLNHLTLSGLPAFQLVLELTLPVDGSRELWLKLGHNQFVVGNYTPDGHFPIWETKLTNPEDRRSRVKTIQHPDCWDFVSNWAKHNNGGVFFVPTQPQGFPIKDAIALSDDIAAELDEGTAEQQLQLISEFIEISGLNPSYIIHSGSKSYHPHWKAIEHLPIEQTVYLRQLLCIALNSDPAIANPHQPMRIAGFYRREKEREQTLEYWSESRYTYDQFLEGIRRYFEVKGIPFPEAISEDRWRIYKRGRRDKNLDLSILTKSDDELYPKPSYSTTPTLNSSYTGQIPLHLALSKANQEALQGVGSGRNNTGLALALDLIGCYIWLTTNDYAVEGDPYDLFINYCQSCSPGGGWSPLEWESIWRSANRRCPTPARGDLTQFIHWYRWEHDPEYKEAAITEWKKNNPPLSREISKDEYEEKFTLPRVLKLLSKKLKASLNKRFKAYGFGKKEVKSGSNTISLPSYYQQSQRLNTWENSSRKFIADSSDTATGKSFDSGRVKPSDFGVEKIIYITSDPRNPTNDTLKDGWAVNSGRHDGLVEDRLGKIRRAKGDKNEKIIAPANCMRTETIGALRKKNVDRANSADLICGGCPHLGLCQSGVRYKDLATGYLGVRARALSNPKIITHPKSLPSAENFSEYKQSLLIWEEWTTILKNTKQIEVWDFDLKELIAHLAKHSPPLLTSLLPVLGELGKIFDEKNPTKFGWNHWALTERLKPVLPKDLDWSAIAPATEPDLDVLNPVSEYGEDIRDMPQEVKKLMTDPDHRTAARIEAETLKQWILPFLQVLSGEPGYLSKSGGRLTITIPDTRLVDLAHAAAKNIFLDATGHLPDLAALLGIPIEEIEHIAVEPEPGLSAKSKYIQVAGLGRLGQQRGKHQERQTAAITKALQEKHQGRIRKIASKKFSSGNDLQWFVESRGANDAEKDEALILEGVPTPNIEALAAEFTCLYGRVPEPGTIKVKYNIKVTNSNVPDHPYLEINGSADVEFRAFVRRRVLANIHQGMGRLRANRRAGEELTIYILGDYPLDVPVELVKPSDITPEAASKLEQFEMALTGAIAQLRAEGKKVTQTALSQITGYSQGYISRFKKLLLSLLESFNSKSNNSESPPDDVGWVAKNYSPLVQKEQLPKAIFNFLTAFGWREFLPLFDLLPQKLKQDFLYWLLAMQPESVVTEIESVVTDG